MSGPVIIRLQNLPLEARSIDIRKFFDGLLIPDGGVHIIGGERGDAFIAFQSDEDARQAMVRDGNFLCNSKIKLFLSSKNEMQNVITAARNQLQQLQTPASSITAISTVASNPIEKILSNNQSQQNPLDLLNSITKLFTKEAKPEPTQPASNISINEILNILKTTQTQKTSNEQPFLEHNTLATKPSLLPTPFLEANDKPLKRKYEEKSIEQKQTSKMPLLPAPANTTQLIRPLEPIVKVKNFDSNCSYKDIRSFLQGVQIEHNGIKFITDSSGAHKGQAFVRLVSIVDLKKALCRNGQFYDDKQIEVSQSSEADILTQTSIKKTDQTKSFNDTSFGHFIKIYGLSARFDDSLLKNMFNNVRFIRIVTTNPTPIQSKIINQDGSQETKTIMKAKKLCEVETQLDVERALTRQDERVGKSRIQIFQISKSEFERELSTVKNLDEENSLADLEEAEDNVDEELLVLLSGIPFSARLEDVQQFFKGINPKKIKLLTDTENLKPTGECVCEFHTKSDRNIALTKNDSLFRNRVVKIKQLSLNEYKQLNQTKPKNQKNRTTPSGIKPALLATPLSLSEKPKLNHDYEEPNYKRSFNPSVFNSNKRVKQSSPIPIDLPPLPIELQKYRNSIVLLSNVCYEATREDILELFKYYSPIEQTLKIRHDDRGQPTGDAIVACKTHEEASKACRSLNGVEFMGQNIRAVLINP